MLGEALYQEIILDHYKNPRGAGFKGKLTETGSVSGGVSSATAGHSHSSVCPPGWGESHQVNPTCGDEVTLRVHVVDEKILDISYEAEGCSISQAAASVLYEQLKGVSLQEARVIHTAFTELVSGRTVGEPDEDLLGDGIAFAGVAKYPARVKCALLPWMAFTAASAQAEALAGSDS